MNEFVPHTGDEPPGNLRVTLRERGWKILYGFPEDLQVSDDCILISPVNSSYVISEVYDRMRSTASAISAQRRWVFDRSGIGDLDGHPLPYGRFESVRGHQVDGGAEVK